MFANFVGGGSVPFCVDANIDYDRFSAYIGDHVFVSSSESSYAIDFTCSGFLHNTFVDVVLKSHAEGVKGMLI